jgi:4-amino-4-deoxy-L-arabinose transferase-like glycosyltransferase
MGPAWSTGARRRLAAALAGREARWLLGILGVALLVRIAVIVATRDYAPWGDPADYDRIAIAFSALGEWAPTTWAEPGTPTAFRAPAYPLLLAAIYDLTGMRYAAARVVEALLGVLSVGLAWAIARQIATDPRVARWAAGLCALLPSLVWLNASLLSETLFVPLLLGAALAVLLHRERPGWRLALLAGVLAGLAVATRSSGAPLVLPLLLGLWLPGRRWRPTAVAAVAVVLVLTPWTVRNWIELDRFMPLGSHAGYTLAGVWNEESNGPGELFAASRLPEQQRAMQDLFLPSRLTEGQLDRELRARGLRYGREHPGFVARATGAHLLRLFLVGPGHARAAELSAREMAIPEGWRGTLRPPVLALVLLTLVAVVGWIRRRRQPGPLWLWAVPVVLLVTTAPLVGSPRYRIPLDPFLALAAATAIPLLLDRLRPRRAEPSADEAARAGS